MQAFPVSTPFALDIICHQMSLTRSAHEYELFTKRSGRHTVRPVGTARRAIVLQRWLFAPVHFKMLDLVSRAGPTNPPSCILTSAVGPDGSCGPPRNFGPRQNCWALTPPHRCSPRPSGLLPRPIFRPACPTSLPVPDQTADLVLSSLSLHHWADPHKGLQEIRAGAAARGMVLSRRSYPATRQAFR